MEVPVGPWYTLPEFKTMTFHPADPVVEFSEDLYERGIDRRRRMWEELRDPDAFIEEIRRMNAGK